MSFVLVNDGAGLGISRRGSGRPLVVLPGLFDIDQSSVVWDRLAESGFEVCLVTFPGFGAVERPGWLDSVSDLALLVGDWIESEHLSGVSLVGCSLGGWVAAELAIRKPGWLSDLVLVDSLGLNAGSVDQRVFADLFALPWAEVCELAFADPGLGSRVVGLAGRPAEDVLVMARGQEAVAAYGWRPYLHDPKLGRRLGRVDVPTLVVWGQQDRIALPIVGEAFAERIASAELVEVTGAGHLPHLEQPDEFEQVLRGFLKTVG